MSSFAAFGRIAGNGFINYDEELYITKNNHVQSGINPESIKWAFTAVVCSNWHPLTLLSHALDWKLFKNNAGGHHLVSLFLHIGAVLLLFFFLYRTTKNIWPSAFAAALFALHPLRVESVAWAAERKDVLSMFFGLASIYAYAIYAESHRLSRYFLCLIFFVLSLMSKPMLVTLPFVLLLLDYWPLKRWPNVLTPVNTAILANKEAEEKNNKQRIAEYTKEEKISAPLMSQTLTISSLLWEKAPFILLSIVSSIVTIWAQNKSLSVASMERLPFPVRISNAVISYASYLGKTLWPVDLAVFYPYDFSLTLWQVLISGFIITAITIAVFYYIKKLPFLFVGWLWYLGTLIPVIGFVQVGKQAMADRYTYLPSIGIAVMIAWGVPLLLRVRKKILWPAGIAVLATLAVLTWQQCGYWENSIKLWNHTLQVTKDNYLAHNNLGRALFDKGKFEESIDHYNKAIRISPDNVDAYGNRGNAYAKTGQYQQAIEDYNKAILLNPYNAEAYYTRGSAYGKLLGQYQRAIEDFNQAIRLNPDYIKAYNNRGLSYYNLGQYMPAIKDFSKAISLKQDYADAYNNRGVVYLNQGNKELVCDDALKACELGDCKLLEQAKVKGYCR